MSGSGKQRVRPDVLELLRSEDEADRARGLGKLARRPDTRTEVIARVEELLTDRTCVVISIPIVYGEVRLLAAKALARLRAELGDDRKVELANASRPMSAARLGPMRDGTDIPLMGAKSLYVELRERDLLPTRDMTFDPADYADDSASNSGSG